MCVKLFSHGFQSLQVEDCDHYCAFLSKAELNMGYSIIDLSYL